MALLVALRERWAVWSVVRLSVTPQSFLSPGHTTLVQPPITLDQALPGALRGNKANLVDRFRNVIQGIAALMIGVVVWPIFQIQRLVTAQSHLDRDSRGLHLYLARQYLHIFYHSHLNTRSPCESRYLLSLTRHHPQMDISSVQKS